MRECRPLEPPRDDHGDIVGGGRALREGDHGVVNRLDDLFGRAILHGTDQRGEAFFAVLFIVGVRCFGDAVGEQDQRIAGIERGPRFLVYSAMGRMPRMIPPASLNNSNPPESRTSTGGLWPALV